MKRNVSVRKGLFYRKTNNMDMIICKGREGNSEFFVHSGVVYRFENGRNNEIMFNHFFTEITNLKISYGIKRNY